MILNTRKHINPGHKEEIQNKNEKKKLTKMDEKMRIITRNAANMEQIMSCTKITL